MLLALVLLLGVAQLVLPGVATERLESQVSAYGNVLSASLGAVPAVELLWGSAESANVRAGHLALTPGELVALLVKARGIDKLYVTAQRLRVLRLGFDVQALEFRDAVLRKRGEEIIAHATLTSAALAAALPGVRASMSSTPNGTPLIRAGGGLFGLQAYLDARVQAIGGRLVVVPTQPLLAKLARVTLFADPRLDIFGISAKPAGGGAYVIEGSARLR